MRKIQQQHFEFCSIYLSCPLASHSSPGGSLMYASTGDEALKKRVDYMVAELAKCQAALPSQSCNKGFLSAYPESLFDRVDAGQPVWAPYYTLHKIMAGLLDSYEHCGNTQALDVLENMAAWLEFNVNRLSHDQMQAALKAEQGGMNAVLTNLYAVTGRPEYLKLAQSFNHEAFFAPLAAGQDDLDGLHASATQSIGRSHRQWIWASVCELAIIVCQSGRLGRSAAETKTIVGPAEHKLDDAMRLLSAPRRVDGHSIIGLLIEVAAECGRLECMADDALQFKLGQNDRKSYRFGDFGGRFRSILGALYFWCESSYPSRIEGNGYGFEAEILVACPGREGIHFLIRTINRQSSIELLMEVQQ